MTTTFEKIRAIIVRDFELPPERLQRDTLLEEIELDSLSITELVFSIEDEFHIPAENTVPAFKTLGDIADYVARLIAERDAKPRVAAKPAEAPATPAPPKRARGGKQAGASAPRAPKLPRAAKGGAHEPSKRPGRAKKANGQSKHGTNGANGANADGAKAAPTVPNPDTPPRKPKRSSGSRVGARTR
jgi:acyl carrier protein